MRRFELVLVFAAVFAVAWPAIFGVRTRRGIVAATLVALFAIHWQIEGLRWQMIPAYVATIGLIVGDLIVMERRLDWTHRISRVIFGLSGVGVCLILPLVLPVPELPVPSGPETIGTRTVQVIDHEREETYGERPGPRRLVAQVWYPALPSDDVEPVGWSEDWDIVAPAMSAQLGLPGWFLGHTRYVASHATASLPVAPGTFPVIVYSHDWAGFRGIALNQIETLVSHGYIVVAADHTYAAATTRFPDGEVVVYNPAALPTAAGAGEEARAEAAQSLVEVMAADITTLVHALEAGGEGPFGELAESADLSRIGVFGHGVGGGAAVAHCLEDERCDAMLGLDPWVEPIPDPVISISATKPALYMRSDGWRGNQNDGVLRGIAERGSSTTYWVDVEGADHHDFVTAPLLSPMADELGWKGPIPSGRVIPIIDRYLVGFFDVFLLETGPAALDTASFDEVSVEVIRPG